MISPNTHKEEEPFHDVHHRTGFARLRAGPPVVTHGLIGSTRNDICLWYVACDPAASASHADVVGHLLQDDGAAVEWRDRPLRRSDYRSIGMTCPRIDQDKEHAAE